eukprot:symbB.v1.2.019886.t1/scaffold1641.1/size211090/1
MVDIEALRAKTMEELLSKRVDHCALRRKVLHLTTLSTASQWKECNLSSQVHAQQCKQASMQELRSRFG